MKTTPRAPSAKEESVSELFDNYINVNELCARLQVSRSHIFELKKKGLPHIYVGKRILRFCLGEVLAWLEHERAMYD